MRYDACGEVLEWGAKHEEKIQVKKNIALYGELRRMVSTG